MQMRTVGKTRLRGAIGAVTMLLTISHLAGCGGSVGDTGDTLPGGLPDPPTEMRPTAALANDWIAMIEEAGLCEYAQLGRELLAQDRVRMVAPPMLDADYNAFAHVNTREIWLNRPMFERYPTMLDQATIFLHELIHIRTGEVTHLGPWWVAQDQFRVYYRDLGTAAVALGEGDAG